MALSPTGLLRAGWRSAKQNIGTSILLILFTGAVYTAVLFALGAFAALLGSSVSALVASILVSIPVILGLVSYLQLVGVRFSFLGSGETPVALREIIRWDGAAVLRMARLYFVYVAAVFVGYLPMLVLLLLSSFVNSSILPVSFLLGALAYVGVLLYMFVIMLALFMACFLVMQGSPAIAAVKKGWAMTAGSRWRLVGYFALLFLLGLLVVLPNMLVFVGSSIAVARGGSVGVGAIASLLSVLYTVVASFIFFMVATFSAGHAYRQLSSK